MGEKNGASPVPRTFARGELNIFLHDGALPTCEDDMAVLMGQTGPRRRATPKELRAFVEEEVRRQASERESEGSRRHS
jgi:hypothetical protein